MSDRSNKHSCDNRLLITVMITYCIFIFGLLWLEVDNKRIEMENATHHYYQGGSSHTEVRL